MTEQLQTNNGKIVALLSYITPFGWIIAFILHSSNKSSLGIFHLRQSGFLHIISIALSILNVFFVFIPRLGGIISFILGIAGIGLFILWIIGLIAAIQGEEKRVPFVGDTAQSVLSGLK